MKSKDDEPEVEEKRRVAKASSIILTAEIFNRYSSVAIASKFLTRQDEHNESLDLIFLAILLLFLNLKLEYDRDVSTAIYHAYELLSFVFAFVGGAIADSWLGMYKTILMATSLFASGAILMAVSAIDSLNLPRK